jgi:hypothetical protein
MKRTSLILLTVLLSIPTFSQIKKLKDNSELIGKVQHISCEKNDTIYTITYADHKFTQISDFKSFSLSEQDFNDLFQIIIQGFIDNPKEEIKLETPNDILFLKFTKTMGIVSLRITHFVNKNSEIAGLTRYLTKKQVLKLFGKKKKK